MHWANPSHFEFQNPIVDPLYFSSTTTTTIGYGDFCPRTPLAKSTVIEFCHQKYG